MLSRSSLGLGGAAALGFVLLTLLVSFVPHEALPEGDSPPPEEVSAFFERNAAMQAAQPVLKALGAFALLALVGVLAVAFRDAGAPVAGAVTLLGGSLFAAVVVGAMLTVLAVVTLSEHLDGSVVFALYNVSWIVNVRAGFAAAPLLVAVGAGVLRTRVLPAWTGYAAFAASLVALAGGVAALALPGPEGIGPGFLGFLAFTAWVLAVGVTMLVRAARRNPAEAAGSL